MITFRPLHFRGRRFDVDFGRRKRTPKIRKAAPHKAFSQMHTPLRKNAHPPAENAHPGAF
jgi:hypothetical protein